MISGNLSGGSMRSGIRVGVAAVGVILAAAAARGASAADPINRVRPVPLGGALVGQTGDGHFGVYVPTKFGGELTINVFVCGVIALRSASTSKAKLRPFWTSGTATRPRSAFSRRRSSSTTRSARPSSTRPSESRE